MAPVESAQMTRVLLPFDRVADEVANGVCVPAGRAQEALLAAQALPWFWVICQRLALDAGEQPEDIATDSLFASTSLPSFRETT
jgi:hypothetical protein